MDDLPENNAVPTAGTDTETAVPDTQMSETPLTEQPVTPERRYSKEEVINMMKKRVARSHGAFFKRYGVENLEGLDNLFEQSKKFNDMNGEFGKIQLKNSELMRENAFLRNNINPDKYADIIAYFKGNDIEFSEEELLKALPTHSEWLKQAANVTTIKSLGSEAHTMPQTNEADLAGKLLGVKF